MSVQQLPVSDVRVDSLGDRLRWTVRDTVEMVKRNLRHIPRSPELLVDVTIQPVIFVLLFRYIFGGAIDVPGSTYVNYLMAGIFAQTLIFAAVTSGIGLAYDLQKGLIDRFRSLPMSRAAVVTGRTLTDLMRGVVAMVVMWAVGLAVGFRPEGNPLVWVLAFALLLLIAFSFSWVGVAVGMLMRVPEAVQAGIFMLVLPFTFASSAFVPTETMPSWLRKFAENQPLTSVIDTLRHAVNDEPLGSDPWITIVWSAVILAIFVPLGVAMYVRRTTE